MKRLLCLLLLCLPVLGQLPKLDAELDALATKLARQVKESGRKKVTLLDFTDLQGKVTDQGRFIVEQLQVSLVEQRDGFAVMDRANLNKILQEHKLTLEGLVEPENAKKLGQFSGVDAIILGKVMPQNEAVTMTVSIIATDTAEIVGAAKARFAPEEAVFKPATPPVVEPLRPVVTEAPAPKPESKQVVKTVGTVQVGLSLGRINDKDYLLTMELVNKSARTLWVAINTSMTTRPTAVLLDPQRHEYETDWNMISGVQYAAYQHGGFFRATELPAGESLTATVRFVSYKGREAASGNCNLQLELLVGREFDGAFGKATKYNVVTDIQAR